MRISDWSSDVCSSDLMDSPLEQGNVPGKFLEYLGARRPILVLGWDQGVPATIVKQRSAGAATPDPEAIARQLRAWLEVKAREGCLPDLSAEVCAGFTHEEQAARPPAFPRTVVDGHPALSWAGVRWRYRRRGGPRRAGDHREAAQRRCRHHRSRGNRPATARLARG